jgi:hypothetical protein
MRILNVSATGVQGITVYPCWTGKSSVVFMSALLLSVSFLLFVLSA